MMARESAFTGLDAFMEKYFVVLVIPVSLLAVELIYSGSFGFTYLVKKVALISEERCRNVTANCTKVFSIFGISHEMFLEMYCPASVLHGHLA